MNNFNGNYNKILKVLKSIPEKEQFLKQKRKSKLKDIELIAMNLTAEYMNIESKCQLFKDISIGLKNKIKRFVYSRRKRKLFFAIAFIINELSTKFNEFKNCFVVDSLPLEVVKLSRSNSIKICKDEILVY